MIDAKTKLCCIIGNPVEHSLSPQMHNAAFKALGLNYVFVAFEVDEVKTAIQGLRAINARGIVVTVPHKLAAMKYVDEIDQAAKAIAAVNAIVNCKGKLKATNTDWIGGLQALKEKTSVKGKSVAILGAGGGARAIAYGLQQHKVKEINVFNRTLRRAQRLVFELNLTGAFKLSSGGQAIPPERWSGLLIKKADIIINTTSVGMKPDVEHSPIPKEFMRKGQVVYDIVYTPRETKLLRMAKEVGATVVYGDKMMLYGGKRIFELFTGKKAPVGEMRKALFKSLKKR